jgi:hypothetical protein
MATNADVLGQGRVNAASTAASPRLADRKLFLTAAIAFPLLVFIGYSRTYYLRPLFEHAQPLATTLVHVHAWVMSAWVLYFTAQTLLIRTKNVKLHMSMGFAGIGLAILVVIVGMSTAVDAHLVRKTAPAGIDPYGFFAIPVVDMLVFVGLFALAIYYRKSPADHKALMLLTAVNFLGAAVARIPLLPPQFAIVQAFAIPDILALVGFSYYTWRHRKFNWTFAIGLAVIIASQPLRIYLAGNETFIGMVGSLANGVEALKVFAPPPMP